MTLFEYLAIAFSLVLSSAAMRLMGGIPHALDTSRRYWVHLAFIVWQLTTTTGVFWTFWSLRNAEWIYPTFFFQLTNLGLLYVNACTLVPENPASVQSLNRPEFTGGGVPQP